MIAMTSLSSNLHFKKALEERVKLIGELLVIDPKRQIKGRRYRDLEFAIDGIQGAVIVQNDPQEKGLVLKEAIGLSFDANEVIAGKYDPLIAEILRQIAVIDFELETSYDLH